MDRSHIDHAWLIPLVQESNKLLTPIVNPIQQKVLPMAITRLESTAEESFILG
jgi:hypothetical protein